MWLKTVHCWKSSIDWLIVESRLSGRGGVSVVLWINKLWRNCLEESDIFKINEGWWWRNGTTEMKCHFCHIYDDNAPGILWKLVGKVKEFCGGKWVGTLFILFSFCKKYLVEVFDVSAVWIFEGVYAPNTLISQKNFQFGVVDSL